MQYDGAVAPGERDYTEYCPPGWTRLVQAEGAPYYYHREHARVKLIKWTLLMLLESPRDHAKCSLSTAHLGVAIFCNGTEICDLWVTAQVDYYSRRVAWMGPDNLPSFVCGHSGAAPRESI